MIQMKFFCFDAETGEDVAADKKHWLSLEEGLNKFDNHNTVESSFIGFININEECMQFLYLDNGNLRMEIPDTDQGGSLAKEVSKEECRKIIEGIYRGAEMKQTPGLTFESW